jgi:signal transduction histidine kinase
MDHTLLSALWLIGGGLVLGLVAGFAAFGLLTTRLQRLAQAMERFRSSNFAEKVPYLAASDTATADEIDRLGHTYNQMADRIIDQLQELRDNDSARRDLIANVSHDLRTPLASLRGYLDTLLLKGDALSERERAFYLETAARQSERLGNLVAQFFELAKLDAGDIKLTREPFVIEELIQDVVQQFRIRAEGKGVELSMAGGGRSHFANADIGLTERALGNLIDNAIRHTESGGSVTVSIRADGSMIEITVADTGSGIPKEALPHVFERSFTLDRSRSSASGGSGLGLAITKRIVELHGGRITVDSVVGEGTRFTFQLPTGDRPGATAMAA